MAVAEASLSTSIDSILLGLIVEIPDVITIPSTTYNRLLDALIDPYPRMRTRVRPPGRPELVVTFTPATFPDNASSVLDVGRLINSSLFTELTEPVKSDSSCVPYPTTTSSSPAIAWDWSSTLSSVRPSIGTSWRSYPLTENTSVS